jgi:hypothetical protein
LNSNFREKLATVAGRRAARNAFIEYYDANPFQYECFARIVSHMQTVYPENVQLDEQTILERGYF